MNIKKSALLCLFISLALILTGFVKPKGSQRNTFKVVGDDNHPPYEFVDENGEYKGFNVDIMKAISKEIGVEVEYNSFVKTIEKGKNKFTLITDDNRKIIGDKVIIATGGCAMPSSGSDGNGYDWDGSCHPSPRAAIIAAMKAEQS